MLLYLEHFNHFEVIGELLKFAAVESVVYLTFFIGEEKEHGVEDFISAQGDSSGLLFVDKDGRVVFTLTGS